MNSTLRFALIVDYSVRKINTGYLGYLLIVTYNGDWAPRDASEDSEAPAQHSKDRTQRASRGKGRGERDRDRDGDRERVSQFQTGFCETVEESISIFTVKIDMHWLHTVFYKCKTISQ